MFFLIGAPRCLQAVNSKMGLRIIPTFKINSYNFSVNKGKRFIFRISVTMNCKAMIFYN